MSAMASNPQTYIELEFADGEYRFKLPLAQIQEVQVKCGAGIGRIFARVMAGVHASGDELILVPSQAEWNVLDLIEVIRQGLIGGNHCLVNGQSKQVGPGDAQRLIEAYVTPRPLTEAWEYAAAILGACVVGYTPPGKDGAAAEETPSETKTE